MGRPSPVPVSFAFARPAPEPVERPTLGLVVHPGPVVPDRHDHLGGADLDLHFDRAAGRDGPQGIVDEVVQDLVEVVGDHQAPGPVDARSDLSRLNRANGASVEVHQDTALLLRRAAQCWPATDGRFDPTVYDAMVADGYDLSLDRVHARERAGEPRLHLPRPSSTAACVEAARCDGGARAWAEAVVAHDHERALVVGVGPHDVVHSPAAEVHLWDTRTGVAA